MISKDTERIATTDIVQLLINKFKLNVNYAEWECIKVPFLYNNKILIQIYCELGSLELTVIDLMDWKWNRIPVDSYDPKSITHKSYFETITSNLIEDKYLNKDCNNYLHYYINFIIDFLPQIFDGDFRKIENHMEPVTEEQKEEILRVIME